MWTSRRLPDRPSRGTRCVAAAVLLLVAGAPLRALADDPWVGRDKAVHFSVTFAIGGGGYTASSLVFERPAYRFLSGLGLALAAGGVKELSDMSHGGGSWKDMTWNLAGAAAGTLLAWGIDEAFSRRRAPRSAPEDALPDYDTAARERISDAQPRLCPDASTPGAPRFSWKQAAQVELVAERSHDEDAIEARRGRRCSWRWSSREALGCARIR